MSGILGAKRSTAEVGAFVNKLVEASATTKPGLTFDSGAASDFIGEAKNGSIEGVKVPERLAIVLDELGDAGESLTKAVLDSAHDYQRQHGVPMPADLMEQAIHSAYSTTQDAASKYKLDSGASANNHNQEPQSLQANRAIVAILGTTGEAVPWVHYAPADIGSNESKIAILQHQAGLTTGAYDKGDMLDGIFSGGRYLSSMRLHTSQTDAEGKVAAKLTAIQSSPDACAQAGAAIKTLRGRAIVYIDGMKVGEEAKVAATGANTVNGIYTKEGVAYLIGGSFNPETGAYALTTTPALPAGVNVSVEAPIDFEQTEMVELTPELVSHVDVKSIFAHSWRAFTRVSVDAGTQMGNELGLDPFSESVMAIQNHYAIERHFDALHKARRIGVNNADTFDFDWAGQKNDKTRARIWGDFGSVLGKQSQIMVEKTLDHGITHLYVGKDLKSQWEALPREMFEPSGVTERPGIYRFGRLFGKFDCYYDPSAKETATSAEILAIGRATTAARNMVVFGDAVAPNVRPLAYNKDMKQGAAFYARNFTALNPFEFCALGAALITVTNLR